MYTVNPKARSALGVLIGALMIAVALLLAVATPAQAATFDVDRTDDPAAGGNLCTAAANDCSLRGAISLANTVDDPDTINVPAGTYTLSIAGASEDANATGDLDITNNVNITGAGARTTIVDANGIDRVFHTLGDVTQVVISGVTITGGDIADSAGGGVFASQGDLTLTEVTVDDNRAVNGGGVRFQDGPILQIERSTISNNFAIGAFGGGGLYSSPSVSATIDNSTIANNQTNGTGGGITLESTVMTIKNSTIADNLANIDNDFSGGGGGLSAFGGASLTYRNNIFARNLNAGSSLNCFYANPDDANSSGYNIADDNSCGFDRPTDFIVDAKLETLADNGGPTDTVALLDTSPAIDSGNADVGIDQREIDRPQDGDDDGTAIDDRGAFEANGEDTPTPAQCDDNIDNDSDGDTDFPDDTGCDSAADESELGTPSISINDVTVTEGNSGTTDATFTISRSGDTGGSSSVSYSTANDTASSGSDYQSRSGTVNFSSGQSEKNVTILINGDTTDEPNERFFVNLESESGATLVDDRGDGNITDDDDPSNTPPGCTITGTSGNDVLNGTPRNDTICGLGGNDRIDAGSGNDTILGGNGNDTLLGGSGADTLRGGNGSDNLRGEAGNDSLGAKDNVRGNDTANGGPGSDACTADQGDKKIDCER